MIVLKLIPSSLTVIDDGKLFLSCSVPLFRTKPHIPVNQSEKTFCETFSISLYVKLVPYTISKNSDVYSEKIFLNKGRIRFGKILINAV